MKFLLPLLLFFALAVGTTLRADALLGTDNASAAAYSGGWTTGTDGFITGEGAYGQWFLAGANSTASGFQISSVASLGGGSSALNTNGVSFGMFGNVGNQADAYRFIDPSGLSIGQTFSIQLAVNWRNGYKGFDLRGNTAGDPTIFNFNVGGDDYRVSNAASGNGSIGNAYSNNSVFTLAFTQNSLAGGNWSITRSGGVSNFVTGTYSGVARSFKLYVGGTDGNAQDFLFVNNLATVPEPSVVGLAGMAALGFAGWRMLRQQPRA